MRACRACGSKDNLFRFVDYCHRCIAATAAQLRRAESPKR